MDATLEKDGTAAAVSPVWMRPKTATAVYGLTEGTLRHAADVGKIVRAKTDIGRAGCVLYYVPSIDEWLTGCIVVERKKGICTNPRGGHVKAKETA